jgi:hypothetical protein
MIDRAELDTRLAAHARHLAHVNDQAWLARPASRGAKRFPWHTPAIIRRLGRVASTATLPASQRPAGA